MDLVAVIAHLKATVAPLGGRVAGAAEFSGMIAGELHPEAFPSAYVVPLGEEAGGNDTSNGLYQEVTERVGVVVEFDNTADRRGQTVTELYAPMRRAVFASLLNWRVTDPTHAVRGFEFASGGILQTDRARLFYQWEFTLLILLTDADGWQVPMPPLRQIVANGGATDPQPPFGVAFPAIGRP